jgi:hypothetical protein
MNEWICRNCHRRGSGGGDELEAHMQTAECKIWSDGDLLEKAVRRGPPWYRRFLRWARIEDEHGVLSLTTVGFVVGCICLLSGKAISLPELAAFIVGVGAYHAKKHQQFKLAQQAVAGAHDAAIAQQEQQHEIAKDAQSEHVKTLGAKVAELGEKLKLLATPEQIDKLRSLLNRR